jgi:thermitase
MNSVPKPPSSVPAHRTSRAVVLLGLLFVFLFGAALPRQAAAYFQESSAESRVAAAYVPNQILVQFAGNAQKSEIAERLSKARAEPRASIEKIGVVVIDVPEGEFEKTIETLQNQPGVLAVEPNYIATAQETIPSDPAWGLQYGLRNIRAPQGWTISSGASWVTIAILDTGVDGYHPDLVLKTLPGYNILSPSSEPLDDNGHGTHVAGIAAAATNNGIGMAGTSWGAQIMPVKVLNASASGTYANVASGIIWAVDNGAQVINLSLGGSAYSAVLESAVNYAYNRGVVLVASSGNAGSASILYPARYMQVIAVGATDSNNQRSAFSNFGDGMELVAPGVSVYSTEPGGGYSYRSGTSMSAPFVSGLAAILIGMPGNYNASWVRNQLTVSALDLGASGWDAEHGYGLIQMDAALGLISATPTPAITPTFTPTFTPTSTSTPAFTPTFTLTNTVTIIPVFTSPATNMAGPWPTSVISSQPIEHGALPVETIAATSLSPSSPSPQATPFPSMTKHLPEPLATNTPEDVVLFENPDKETNSSILPYLGGCFLSLGVLLLLLSIFLFRSTRRE